MSYTKIPKWLAVILAVAVMIPSIGCRNEEAGEATPTPFTTPSATAVISEEPDRETGTLSCLKGDVLVLMIDASDWIAATPGMKISAGCSLKTVVNSSVHITFFNSSVMELEADSEISIQELIKASNGSTTIRINQLIGTSINCVQNILDSSSTYEIETAAGSVVARGSICKIQVNQYNGLTQTCINTIDEGDQQNHSVTFNGSGSSVEVLEGMSACCWEEGVPGNPYIPETGRGGCCRPRPTPTPVCQGCTP